MIESVRSWWQVRTSREQVMLILLALFAVPILCWYGVVRPFEHAFERAHMTREADALALADVLRMAARISGTGRPAPNGQPLDALVRAEAEASGFTVASVVRDGDGAVLVIEAVRPEPFFTWIAAIRQRRGLIVTRLTARPNGDSTLSVLVRFARAR